MANLVRVRAGWTGTPLTGDGVSTFYFDEAHTGFVADVVDFFLDVQSRLPIGTLVTVPNTGDLIDVTTGALTGTWTDTAAGPVGGTGAGTYARGVGARVTWATSGIKNGRRVRGSTFLVPLVTAAYDTDGTILAAVLTQMQTAVNDLVTASGANMKIWSQAVNGAGGQANTVVGGSAPDKVSWLRSRRT